VAHVGEILHLGVIEELRAAGARIDRIAGASMGALIAGAVAQDLDDAAIYEAAHRNFVAQNPSGDYTVPLYSLVRGRRTQRLLAEAFGTTRIEQLPLRFFCVSTDLNTRSLVVRRTGPLHEAVFASLSIPGVFPPVRTPDGRLLVDGGVLDNLPVETMARDAEGPVIAVDVTRGGPWEPKAGNTKAAWRSRASAILSGQQHELPRLAETMLRTLAVGSRDTFQSASRHADLVITPQVHGAGILDWRALPGMRDAGRAAVRELLRDEPQTLQRYL
jgi:NTE family protein